MPEPAHPARAAGLPLLLVAVALAAPGLAPHPPDQQPDPPAGARLPPGSERLLLGLRDGRALLVEELAAGPRTWRAVRLGRRLEIAAGDVASVERRRFLLGTDRFGRDVLSRLLAGARPSLAIGGLAAGLALLLGTVVACLAEAGGRPIAVAAVRLTDALLSIPRLFLLLGVAAALSPGPAGLALTLALTSWMPTARLVGGELRTLGRGEVALAARAAGASRGRVLRRHLLPAALPAAVTDAALRAGDFVLIEASLSFLGAGVQPPTASWGNMVAESADPLGSSWWLVLFPGLAVLGTVAALSFWADGLRDRLDVRRPGRCAAISSAPPGPGRRARTRHADRRLRLRAAGRAGRPGGPASG